MPFNTITYAAACSYTKKEIERLESEEKYVGSIAGDGTTKTFTITHNLNTRDLAISIYNSSTYEDTILQTIRRSVNTLELTFGTAPAVGENYTVVCLRCRGAKGDPGNVQDVKLNGTSVLDANNVANLSIENNVTSTAADHALSANMGKTLQDQITNLKNIGRFLAIWDCTLGLPETDPTTMPYAYRTGDYFRVGTVADEGGTNYKPNGASYTGAASTTVETDDVAVGAVYYYDGSQWLQQAAGAGGLVQDVQLNGVTILDLNSGIANLTDAALGMVKYAAAQTLTAQQKTQARANIGAGEPINVVFLAENE